VFPPDSKVRLRFINAGAHTLTWFSVDDHVLSVIEADDTAVGGTPVHRIPVNVAQRYSAVLDTSGHEVGDTFYLRSQINTGCLGTQSPRLPLLFCRPDVSHAGAPWTDLNPETLIVIRIGYDDDSALTSATPTSIDWQEATNGTCVDLDDCTLSSISLLSLPLTPAFSTANLVPVITRAAPPTASTVRRFDISFQSSDFFKWTVDGTTYENTAYKWV
jgi:FtsP/CotA-like multicopper oxidase with cupredoxin domain